MNKAMIAAATFIGATTAFAVGLVGDTNSCGEVSGWSTPATIFVSLSLAAVLGYFAGHGNRIIELRTRLIEMHSAFSADPPATVGSTFQLAAHYYDLVSKAKPVLAKAIDKLGK